MLFLAVSRTVGCNLVFRIRGDVMRQQSVFVGHISREVIYFVAAQLLLHFSLAWPSGFLPGPPRLHVERKGRLPACRRLVLRAGGGDHRLQRNLVPRTGSSPLPRPGGVRIGPFMAGQVNASGSQRPGRCGLLCAALAAAAWAISAIGRASLIGLAMTAVFFRRCRQSSTAGQPASRQSAAIHHARHRFARLDYLKRFGGTGAHRISTGFSRMPTSFVIRRRPLRALPLCRHPRRTQPQEDWCPIQLAPGHRQVNPTLGDVLRKSGYHTIYSTDEVRFANIDETYGFDQVVTHRSGQRTSSSEAMSCRSFQLLRTHGSSMAVPILLRNRERRPFQPETYLARLDARSALRAGRRC